MRILWSLAAWLVLSVATVAAEPARIERRELEVTVTNEAGQSVSGVRLIPWAIGSNTGHSLWHADLHGPAITVETGMNGQGSIEFPTHHLYGSRTNLISVRAVHPDYCIEDAYLDVPRVGDDASTPTESAQGAITLRRGTRIRVGVVVGDGQELVRDVRFLLTGFAPYELDHFTVDDDGWFTSRPFPPDWNWLRGVQLRADGPPLFTSLVQWTPDDAETHEMLLSLEPGTRVAGRLGDSVPRPVCGGRVVATATDPVATNYFSGWHDVAEIHEDGSFAFTSLPRGSDVQLIAVCDGFVSSRPAPDRLRELAGRYGLRATGENIHYPQVFPADADAIEPVIEMERTAICRILVVNADGKGMPDLRVDFWPNHYRFGQGSLILGTGYRSSDVLRNRRYDVIGDKDFQRVTDAEGRVEFTNLPGRELAFQVFDTAISRPCTFNGGHETMEVKLQLDAPVEVTVTLD